MLIYVVDNQLSETSGELSHIKGFINSWARNDDLILVTIRENKELLDSHIVNSQIKYLNLKNKILNRMFLYCFVFFIYLRYKNSFIYIRESFFTSLNTFFLILMKKKYLVEVNGVRFIEEDKLWKIFILNFFKPFFFLLYKNSFCTITVASGITKYLKDNFKIKKIYTIENGTSLVSNFNKKIKKNKEVVFIGNYSKWQDFSGLLELINLKKDYISSNGLKIVLYGDGVQKHIIRDFIHKYDLLDIVEDRGFIKKDKIQDVLIHSLAGLLIDTRFIDGLPLFSPLKYFDYFSCGIPTLLLGNNKSLNHLSEIYNFDELNFENIINNISDTVHKRTNIGVRSWDDVIIDVKQLIPMYI